LAAKSHDEAARCGRRKMGSSAGCGLQPASTALTSKYSGRCGLDGGARIFAGRRPVAGFVQVKKCDLTRKLLQRRDTSRDGDLLELL
jgi:hypothetical protein